MKSRNPIAPLEHPQRKSARHVPSGFLLSISELIQLILHRLWQCAADLASKILIVMMRNESGLHFLVFIHCTDEIIDSYAICPISKHLTLFRAIRSDDVDGAVLLPAIIGLLDRKSVV